MITDIDGEFGFVVSGPSKKSPSKNYTVVLPREFDGIIVWADDKGDAINTMTNFVLEAQKALEVLYGYPGGGGSAPPLRLVGTSPVPVGQAPLAEAA